MIKRIFALFILMLFLTSSFAFAQEESAPAPDSGGGGDGGTAPDSGSSGGGGTSDSGSSTSSGSDGGSGTSDSGSSISSGGGGEGGTTSDSGTPSDSGSGSGTGDLQGDGASQPSSGGEGSGSEGQPSFEQRTCPEGMCMKGEDCVPCPDSSQDFSRPGEDERRDGPRIPPGCRLEKGEFGDFVKCDKKDFGFDEEERKCREDGGRFHRTERGPECSFENREGGGFFSAPTCPEDLKGDMERCSANKGVPETFIDRNGCKVISCGYGNGRENFRDLSDPRECEARGGKFVILKGEPRCFTSDDRVRIKERLDEVEPTDLLKIALKLENILRSLEEIGDNFEDLKNFYEKRGDAEKAASFERALIKIDGAAARLDEIKFGLAEKVGDVTEEDRHQVIRDIQDIKNIMQDIAVDILTGGRSSRSERRGGGEFDDEFEDDFDDEGINFMNAIRQCEEYSESDPYSFSPEKGVNVELRGLKDGKCIMAITPPGFESAVEFLLPPKTYQFFDGPHLLLSSDVDCSPEDACAMMRRFIESEDKGRRPRERFGEKERMEPKECKDAGAAGEKCFDLMFIKLGPPPECRGLSLQECKEKTFRQPKERRDEFREEEFGRGDFREEFEGDGEFGQPSRSTREGQDFRRQSGSIPPECEGLSPDECKKLFMGREGFEGDFGNPDDFRRPIPPEDFRDFRESGDFGSGDFREPEDFRAPEPFITPEEFRDFETTQPTEPTQQPSSTESTGGTI